ncbi:MAG: SAM-dependent methyltransferase, partial [Spirochaetia bacterium]|nr:SAM-dependent methyltransferase [Spirochaetia bacterium]
RQAILAEVERLLATHGYLLIGHTENLLGVRHSLKMISPSVFQKA